MRVLCHTESKYYYIFTCVHIQFTCNVFSLNTTILSIQILYFYENKICKINITNKKKYSDNFR